MKIVEHISTLSPLYLPGGDRPSLLAGDQLEIVQWRCEGHLIEPEEQNQGVHTKPRVR